MSAKLKFICELLLVSGMLIVFSILVYILGTGATFLVYYIGKHTRLGNDIFIYVFHIIAVWKAWDALSWLIGKIVNRKENHK